MMPWTDRASLDADASGLASLARERFREFGFCDPAGSCPVGTAPVLTVTGQAAALFRVEVREGAHDGVGLGPQAMEAARVALAAVRRELGGLRPGRAAAGLTPSLRRVWDPSGGAVVEGASLGLSTALAAASWLLELPVPATVAASAQVGPDGRLSPVEGLPAKLALLEGWAPRVERLLVARGQALPEVRGRAEVIAVGDLWEGLVATWPHLDRGGLEDLLLAREDGPALARRLFGLAVRGSPQVLAWGGVRRLAGRLRPRMEGEAAWQAEVVEAIAARHDADNGVPLPLPDLSGLPWGLRLELRAQELQHLADQATGAWREACAAAEAEARAATGLEGAARIHGALGRLYAAWGEVGPARTHLEAAVAGWRALFLEGQASRPLCEWLRVLGAAEDRAGVRRVLAHALPATWEHPDCGEADRAYLSLAVGRALIQAGAPEEAAPWLRDRPGEAADTAAARLRWRLQVAPAPGDEDRLAQGTGALWAEARALVGLDRGGQDLSSLERGEVARLLSWRPRGTTGPRHVARWWRY